jgi:diguanylate cyclase (GGDEF)-like protein
MVAASILPDRSAAGSGKPAGQLDRPAICIFATAEEFESLAETLSKIGYQGIAGPSRIDAHRKLALKSFSATIIGDSIDNSLELAAKMSVRGPVLLITSEGSIEARLAAARAGVDAILSRPLDVSELAEWLNDVAGAHRETPLSILIIDDDEILAQTYALALENAGMRAVVETDPAAALSQMTTTYPDLILMDLRMPDMTGVELAKVIRQSRRYLSLPIVFLSAEREPARQLEARKLGGDDFISKPVDLDWLVSLVRMRAERAIRLRSMMERDSLTGLLNHGRFIDRLYHELERCRRNGTELSLVLIDVDRFKDVNDNYGHVNGDQVLRTLALTLSIALRRIDIVGRYGGEEFGLLLLDTPPEAASVVVDKIRRRFSEIEFNAKKQGFFVTFSAGVAGSRTHLTPEELISAADEYMYQAKAAGRDRVLGKHSGSPGLALELRTIAENDVSSRPGGRPGAVNSR